MPSVQLFPLSWYWLADDGRVYSAPAQSIVTVSDAGYEAFIAAGNKATRWPVDNSGNQTNASLTAVIGAYGLALSPAAALIAQASALQTKIAAGGISVNVGTTGSPNMIEASTSTAALVLLQGAATVAANAPTTTFQWVQSTGVAVTLTAAQVQTIFAAVTAFIQSTFTTLAAVIAAINAGTITTAAQVASPPNPTPAWPVNS